jgi:PAS domain S-box-containing protein
MTVLFLNGSVPDLDDLIVRQLATVDDTLDVQRVSSSADALIELRKPVPPQAIFVSPSLSEHETLALIASLRRDRVPVAIVPIVDESHRNVFASAVATGADDVLLARGHVLVHVGETLARIRQSPHLSAADARPPLRVLYAGRDALVWNLIEQVPFVRADRVACAIDGACPVRAHGSADGTLRCDAVVIDEEPGDAHPLQVLKSVKAQASDLPVILITGVGSGDIATAALELGADDTVVKSGIFRRRLIATLRRVHQRQEIDAHHDETRAREERLRQIVENAPCSLAVIGSEGAVLAMNGAGLGLFGAIRPREVIGRDFRTLVAAAHHDAATDWLHGVVRGGAASLAFDAETLTGERVPVIARAATLDRHARGGRGMIVTFEPAAGPPHAAEPGLDDLQAALQQAQQQIATLQGDLAADKEARDTQRGLEHELELVRGVLAAERQEWDRLRMALEAARSELHHTDQARAADRAEWAAERAALEAQLAQAVSAIEQEREARRAIGQGGAAAEPESIEHERQEMRATVMSLRADMATLTETLAAERVARDRNARERDALRATLERDEALRADMDARAAQSNRDAALKLEKRESDLIERCSRLSAQLADSERRRQQAEERAEQSLQESADAAVLAVESREPHLEDTGALASAMMPDLESLIATLRDDERQLRLQLAGLPPGTSDRDRHDSVVTHLAVLIRQLGAFTRREASSTSPVDLNIAVSQAEPMLAHLVGPYVGFEVRLGTAATVDVPQADLDQLLTSLVTFARDTLPAGGTIVVASAAADETPEKQGHAVGPRLIVKAMGYGARCPAEATAVALVAQRCGGELTLSGENGWRTELGVSFSKRAERPRRPWLAHDDNAPARRATLLD